MMMSGIEPARRLDDVVESGLRRLFDLSTQWNKPIRLISFGIGDVNMNLHPLVQERLAMAIKELATNTYGPTAGFLSLRKKIVDMYRENHGVSLTTDEIVVTTGAIEGLCDIMLAYLNPGDEILLTDPGFMYIANQARLAGAKPRTVALDENLQISADLVAESLTSQTKIVVINFPSNPTGSHISSEQMKGLVELAEDHNFLLVSDETYEQVVYRGKPHTALLHGMSNVLVVSSFSKIFRMTGHRVGFVLGSPEVVKHVYRVHQYNTTCTPSPSQRAAEIALDYRKKIIKETVDILKERRDALIDQIRKIDWLEIDYEPDGAFYLFPRVRLNNGHTVEDVCERLLIEKGVVLVPGSEFGQRGKDHVRLSYGFVTLEDIQEAGKRMQEFRP